MTTKKIFKFEYINKFIIFLAIEFDKFRSTAKKIDLIDCVLFAFHSFYIRIITMTIR